MMVLTLAEWVALLLFLATFASQVAWPWACGRPLFPWLRRR